MPSKSKAAASKQANSSTAAGKKPRNDSDEAYQASKATKSGISSKPKKDPNAPKKPMSSYFLFMNDRRGSLAKTHPNLTGFGEKTK